MAPVNGNRSDPIDRTAAPPLRAAIVGLGQVGSRFDEEPRPSVWSHAGAYLALADEYELVGGADPDREQRSHFARRVAEARVFSDPIAMLAETKPDVLSVCTPPAGRGRLIARLLGEWRPRVVICEKPLELNESDRRALVALCTEAAVPVIVNYTRRYESTYRAARRAISDGRIGRLVSVTVRAPNRLWSIGSHAVNLIAFLAGDLPISWLVQPLPSLDEGGEPAAHVLFEFRDGTTAALITVGRRDVLVFEVDIVGDAGRVIISDNGAAVTLTVFERSGAFLGYRVPSAPIELATRVLTDSPFVEMAREGARVARSQAVASSDGHSALGTESIVESIIETCRKGING